MIGIVINTRDSTQSRLQLELASRRIYVNHVDLVGQSRCHRKRRLQWRKEEETLTPIVPSGLRTVMSKGAAGLEETVTSSVPDA